MKKLPWEGALEYLVFPRVIDPSFHWARPGWSDNHDVRDTRGGASSCSHRRETTPRTFSAVWQKEGHDAYRESRLKPQLGLH